MLITTHVSAPNITATYSAYSVSVYSEPCPVEYLYDDDAGPIMNHSAAMRRLAEKLMGKAMAYDDQWVGIMTDSTTCVWTRKPYTLS